MALIDVVISSGDGSPGKWRTEVLERALQIGVWLGLLACIPSVYLAVQSGLAQIAVLDVIVLAIVFAVYRAKAMPFVTRSVLFCGCVFVLGIALLIGVGTFSQMFLMAAAIITTLLLGVRAGLALTAVTSVLIALIGVLGLTGPEVILPTQEFYGIRWLVIALNYALLTTVLTVAISMVIRSLETAVERETAARVELEERQAMLQQSQKMEAIGQLAGGIAHDFNNLLTIIFGYTDMLRRGIPARSDYHESVEAIADAANRAAVLTRQLLAYSRKTLLQPKLIDLNATVRSTGSMLARLIGDAIVLTLDLDSDPLRVRVDPAQLDQVLMNLAVNARDAMPDGGSLTMSTRRVVLTAERAAALETSPGAHAVLTIADTGGGISGDVLPRIFEPFFSTKPTGAGSGLGLSMVFGILRQSGGAIAVESASGSGASFHIHLPLVSDDASH